MSGRPRRALLLSLAVLILLAVVAPLAVALPMGPSSGPSEVTSTSPTPQPSPVPSVTVTPSVTPDPRPTPPATGTSSTGTPSPSATRSAKPDHGGPHGSSQPRWVTRIDRLVGGIRMSVAIGDANGFLYRHGASVRRIPASNEKLLLSMALLDALGPDATVPTRARAAAAPVSGVIDGNLWLVGRGDPEVDRPTIASIARKIATAGVTRITGRVLGSTEYFRREAWAVGWRAHYTRDEVPFPTALAFRGNVGPSGGHVDDPERRAAEALTHRLRRRGIRVGGKPGMGRPSTSLTTIATVRSQPLSVLLREMDVDSLNFYADELVKVLGATQSGPPATFEEGAHAIHAYEQAQGVGWFAHHDGSGLSYEDRVTTGGIVQLLWAADAATWGPDLRAALPHRGQGTLVHRLKGVRVRAKTGTLDMISALSGWVWLEKEDAWGQFSIVSRGLDKDHAIRIEDAIVKTVSRNAP